MKAKFFLLALMVLFVSAQSSAQLGALMNPVENGGTKNLTIGFSPYGYTQYKIGMGDEKYKYNYKSCMNINLGYESNNEMFSKMMEFSYSWAKFDKSDLKGTSQWFNPNQTENITSIGVSIMAGKTLNSMNRLQFPIYFGPRLEYVKGGPFHNLTINACLKARVKFYFTDRFGIYVGGTGFIGWGSKKAHAKGEKGDRYHITPLVGAVDAGLVINLSGK